MILDKAILLLKNSYLGTPLIKIRYLLYRYVKNRQISSHFVFDKNVLNSVDKDRINFFGYYNISPENEEGDILYLKVTNEDVRGSLVEPSQIMLKDKEGKITKIAKTKVWNWQQGCMLQWLPKDNKHIIFNDLDNSSDNYISKVIDKSGRIIKMYTIPIYSVSKTGKYALSLNFSRLAAMRPDYGYFNLPFNNLPPDNEDGIWYVDLKTGTTSLLLTLEQLKAFSYVKTMYDAKHKVNHIDIAPDGSKFMFLHRWIGPKGRFTRLVVCNKNGSNLKILNGDTMVSHCCWLNSSEILAFCNYKGDVGYYKFDLNTETAMLYSKLLPRVDGHPSISPDGKYIITDTYPNLSRFSSLCLFNIEKEEIKKVGDFYQSLRYNKEIRCDLHPKWDTSGNKIYFESTHQGNRKLYELILR